MKQTAVEWLIEQLENHNGVTRNGFEDCIQQAKQMEKEQIIRARQDGYESTYNSCESGCMGRQTLDGSNEQYYNETFKSE